MKTHSREKLPRIENPNKRRNNIVSIYKERESEYQPHSKYGNCRWSPQEVTSFINILTTPENAREYVMDLMLDVMKEDYNKRLIDIWIFYQFLLSKSYLLHEPSDFICVQWDNFRKDQRSFRLLQERIKDAVHMRNFVGEKKNIFQGKARTTNFLLQEEMLVERKYIEIIELCSKQTHSEEEITKILSAIPEIYNDSFLTYQQRNLLFGWYNFYLNTRMDVDEDVHD